MADTTRPTGTAGNQEGNTDAAQIQDLQHQIAEAEMRRVDAERDLLRLRVAARHGLSEQQARWLQGETVEELDADARTFIEDGYDLLARRMGGAVTAKARTTPPRAPRPRLRVTRRADNDLRSVLQRALDQQPPTGGGGGTSPPPGGQTTAG